MASSDADDFEPDDRQASPGGKILPFPSRRTPDWLMGPADDLFGTAPEDGAEEPSVTLAQPVLRRPGSPTFVPAAGDLAGAAPAAAGAEPVEVATPPTPRRRGATPGVWAPVASSVPIIKVPPPAESAPAQAPASAGLRPLAAVARLEDVTHAAPLQPALAPLREPWWVVVLDTLRTSRIVQLAATLGVVAVVLLGGWLWPRGAGTTSLSEVRRNPSRFDGRLVHVRGRVGDDVFTVGDGWAFFLLQGRDTIVTFTRSQSPKPHEVVTVKGQVSTGFLDGVPRPALFEDSSATN